MILRLTDGRSFRVEGPKQIENGWVYEGEGAKLELLNTGRVYLDGEELGPHDWVLTCCD